MTTHDIIFKKSPLQALVSLVSRTRTKSNEEFDLKNHQIFKRKKTDPSD